MNHHKKEGNFMITKQENYQITDSDILDLQLILELLEKDECKFTLPEKDGEALKPTFSTNYPWSLYFDFESKEFFFEHILQGGLGLKNQNRELVLGNIKFIQKTYFCDPYINEWTYLHRITNKETVNTLFVVKGKDYFSNPFDEIKTQKELTRQNLMKVISDLIKEKVVKNSTIAVSKKNFTVVQLTTKNLTSEETAKIFPSVVKDLTNLRFGKIYYLIGKQVFINEELFIKGYLNQTDTDKVKILNKIKRKNIIRAVGLEKLKSVFLIKHHQSEFEEFIKRLREE